MVKIDRAILEAFPLKLPPLPEQRKIAAILSSVDDTIERTQAVIDQLEVVKKGLLTELLTRGIPGRHKEFKKTEIGKIPATWDATPLGASLDRIEPGWSPLCESQPANNGEWGVLKVSAVTWGEFKATENKRLPKGVEPRPGAEVRDGDLLLSRANTKDLVGRSVLVRNPPPRLMASDKLLRLRVNPTRARAAFLNYVLSTKNARDQIEEAATGSSGSMKNISQEKLRAVLVPLPPVGEQESIVQVLESIADGVSAEAATLRGIRNLKTALLDALFSGRIRVNTTEQEAA